MKKNHLLPLFFMVCASLFAQNISLDQAIRSSAQTIESRLPQGAKTAVLAFTSFSQGLSDYIIGELATAFSASRKVQIIERQFTDAIRRELNIQMSGDVSDDEVRRVGRQLGAQYVVTGSLIDVGNTYRITVVAINVETAVREASAPFNLNKNDPQVTFLLSQQPRRIYGIGDIGPGGGMVFYDKGNFSDGWRYLEVAPVETEFQEIQWGAYQINKMGGFEFVDGLDVTGTATVVGSGKRNTQIVIEFLNRRGERGRAAQLCANLNFNGYNDWFLPSKDELELIYRNIASKRLAGFNQNGAYYSSSQHFDNSYGPSYRTWVLGMSGIIDSFRRDERFKARAVRAF